MSPKTTEVTVGLEEGKQLKVVDGARETKPYFYMIGTGDKRTQSKIEPINFLNEVIEMSKAEQFVIKTIVEKIGYSQEIGEAYIPTSMFNSGEVQKWKKGIKALKEKQLVGSTKRSHFMINPNAFIPKEYENALTAWNKIVKKGIPSKSPSKLDTKSDPLPYDYPEEGLCEEIERLPYDHPSE